MKKLYFYPFEFFARSRNNEKKIWFIPFLIAIFTFLTHRLEGKHMFNTQHTLNMMKHNAGSIRKCVLLFVSNFMSRNGFFVAIANPYFPNSELNSLSFSSIHIVNKSIPRSKSLSYTFNLKLTF